MSSNELGIAHELTPTEQEIVTAVTDGLKASYKIHESLGEGGRSSVQPNQFGETALVIDIRAEEAVLKTLKQTSSSFQIFSEEHGKFNWGGDPQYTVMLDGLDGSDEYKKGRGIRMYGTMASVLRGSDPAYDDYLVSGIMIHSPHPRLFIAVKGKGCFIEDVQTGARSIVKKLNARELTRDTIIDLDTNWDPFRRLLDANRNIYPNMQCAFLSEAARCALFIEGKIDVALEWTRKGNLEQPVAYGLVKEVGGEMTTTNGLSMGGNKFITFGQDKHMPLVIARSQNIAQIISQALNLGKL